MLSVVRKLVTPHTLTASTMPKLIEAICTMALEKRATPMSK